MTEVANLSTLPYPGDVLAEKYTIESIVGQGAMGVVYKARHRVTGKIVAIKVLQPHVCRQESVSRRFLQEARASARISHRNIVDTYDTGEWNGLPYLIMEFLSGESLEQRLARTGSMTIEETTAVLGPVCAAVHAAHRAGIIHRDLKPENIFLNVEPETDRIVPKVLDFGVSKVVDPSRPNLTATGHAIGTALYMPLEQMFGARDVTPAADVYALGVILYECVSGGHPYDASSVPELALKMSNTAPVPLAQRRPDLPLPFCDAVMRALEKDVAARLPDVPTLVAALAPYGLSLGDSGPSAIRSRPGYKVEEPTHSSEFGETIPSGRFPAPSHPSRPSPSPEQSVSTIRRSPEVATKPPPKRKSRAFLAAIGAGAAVVVGALVAFATKPARTEPSAAPAILAPSALAPSVGAPARPRFSRLAVVVSDRPGASVRIDGTPRGSLDRSGAVELSLDPGEHFVEIVSGDVVVASRTVAVEEGAVTNVQFDGTIVPPNDETADESGDERGSGRGGHRRAPDSDAPRTNGASATGMQGLRLQGGFEDDPY